MEYKPGDEVLISTETMKRSGIGTPKFIPLWIGPFKILKRIEPTAHELELAQGMRMHDVFHVSLLKPWNSEGHGFIPIPPTLTLAEQQEFEVHRIMDHREKHVKHVGKGRPKSEGNILCYGEARITVVIHGNQKRICRMRAGK